METYSDPFLTNEPIESFKQRFNKTSMAYWLPLIKHLNIPMPKTEIIPITYAEGWDTLSEQTHKDVELSAIKMGFPCFIKTDLDAGKHDYVNTCYIPSLEKLHSNMENLRDDNFCHDRLFEYIAVREYIQLQSQFTAFHDLPIAPERRYFIDNGQVVCHHRYWPEDAIEFFNIKPDTTGKLTRFQIEERERERCLPLLRQMNYESPEEIKQLTAYAELVAQVLPEYWSVDFALGQNGQWYLIDMAEGHRSWHDDDCPVKIEMDK